MRVLFAIMPSPTHLHPFVPLAWALQGAGHDVRVAGHPDMAGTITDAGLTAVALGDRVDLTAAVDGCVADERLDRIIDPLVDPAEAGLWKVIRSMLMSPFWMHYPRETPGAGERPFTDELIRFARAWKPDLVLWDPMCFAGAIAARACGAAHARLLWGPDYFAWTRAKFLELLDTQGVEPHEDLMADMMEPTLRRLGIAFDEDLLVGQWSVDPMPIEMRLPVDLDYVSVRRVPYTGAQAVPGWLQEHPKRPRVCLTLGVSTRAFFSKESQLPMAELLGIVADMDVEMVATLNADQLASVDRVPDNVRTVDYVPLNQLLPSCSAIIHHGSGGTFAAAVANKVPQLIGARATGQSMDIARYVADRGAGLVGPDIASQDFSAADVKEKLTRLLENPSFQSGADALHKEFQAMPSPNEIVPDLERLTAQHHA
ncbi:L-rhodinosyltransferase/glycosyltransferase [Nocardiopsis mwathae]|uniref:L-rhodinosyltransferase/glycosyltransferase n=1 Tax=Nocardiopsis mwathae TaxID=1472723 RepID=A0A7W9YNC7_9ACTN|nr:activator-dependent family glycosyltransferase [Nocardiopsis mwathae]MBB6174251.1 L-rhodinosyltransferase/glycosyltransferase [Nocardiopsis mwathae]